MAVPAFPAPVDRDSIAKENEAQFRRDVERTFQDITAYIERVAEDPDQLALHVLADTTGLGASHSTSGLTAGQVLRASGATAAAFAALVAGDIPSLAASKITSGVFGVARIPDLNASKIDAGTFGAGNYVFPADLTVQGDLRLGDDDELLFGANDDFSMQHQSSTGNMFLNNRFHGAQWFMEGEDAGGTNRAMFYMDPDAVTGAYRAFFGGAEKMRTTSTGITVTTAVFETSVRRNKENIRDQDRDAVRDALAVLRPRVFQPKIFRGRAERDDDGNPVIVEEDTGQLGPEQHGFIAEEMPDLLGGAASETVSPTAIASLAVKGYQDLEARVAELERAAQEGGPPRP